MKYIILLGDGMAGLPLKELGGKTTLEFANTPNMDLMAKSGRMGLAKTVPTAMPPGSDVANLSVLGYDPKIYYTGRAPLEAASIGVELEPDDVAYRCNLVTLDINHEGSYCTSCTMKDFSAGHITTPEAAEIIGKIDERLGSDEMKFYPGVSYRHLMVWKHGADKMDCTPPHDITGQNIADKLPKGTQGQVLIELMKQSSEFLEYHPVNKQRIADGKLPANCIWLWGQGKMPKLGRFFERYGINGAMISAVDLMKGIAKVIGLESIDVPGATGYIDTNYIGKAEAALDSLNRGDFVYVHVEAPDEAGHGGKMEHKIKAIEDFDELVVGTIMKGIAGRSDCRVLVMPDHPTPIVKMSHTSDPVPFIVWSPDDAIVNPDRVYSESCAKSTGLYYDKAWHIIFDMMGLEPKE